MCVNNLLHVKKKRYFLQLVLLSGLCVFDDVRTFVYTPLIITFSFFILFWNFPSLVYYTASRPLYYEDIFIDEKKLLTELPKIYYHDFQGTHWQPSLIPRSTWDKVEGFSEEFSPGLGSDPDFNMKLWKIGVRLFKGLGKCRVYHFSSISLRKKAWNNGAKTFLKKWGISIKFFKKHYLKSDSKFESELSDHIYISD